MAGNYWVCFGIILALIGFELALIGFELALIGFELALIGFELALIGFELALLSQLTKCPFGHNPLLILHLRST